MRRFFLTAALVLCAGLPARADEPKLIGAYKDWSAYSFTENGKPVCYMAAKPLLSRPAGLTRGDVFAMITHRPGEKSFSVVSVVAGYTYKKDTEVTATIGTQRFALFTDGDTAWARDEATDMALVTGIKSGDQLTVTGASAKGTQTTDTFSLKGAGAAYKAIGGKCKAP